MRRAPSNSARTVAFAVALCALSIAPGCGQETFDLLSDSAPSSGAPSSGAPSSGAPSLGGGGLGGSAAASANAGLGGGGKASAGGGGRFGIPPGGGSGNFPCLGEGGCPDDVPPVCSKSSPFPFCIPCETQNDCMPAVGDARLCDPVHKRCVECINEFQCGFGEACNLLNQRCAKACDGNHDSCAVDGQHLLCSRELGVCVACINNQDCSNYGPNQHCSQSVCVECSGDSQCMMGQACLKGHCVKL